MRHRMAALAGSLLLALSGAVGLTTITSAPAHADSCYSWSGDLAEGDRGDAVRELQIRVAGWAGHQKEMLLDGVFGPMTKTAVTNFQDAYGLEATGVADDATYAKIYELQKDDCSPAHFSWAEVDGGCGNGGYAGGSVSEAEVKDNLKAAMWRAEALRHSLGDHPLRVTSGFRSVACDKSVGGSGSGQHTYGKAIDLVPADGGTTYCSIASEATNHAFTGIFGPGYVGHDDHVHVDIRSGGFTWSAPDCGI